MRVSFLSIDDSKNKIMFTTEYEYNENVIKFKDESIKDTFIEITILSDTIILKRYGKTNTYMEFNLLKTKQGKYQNDEGLIIDFEIKTTKLEITKTKIRIDYDFIIENQIISRHKISLLFNKTLE